MALGYAGKQRQEPQTPGVPPGHRHADDSPRTWVHVHPGTHSADPLVQLHLDPNYARGVDVRLTLTLAEAQQLLADLQRVVEFHTGPPR